MALKISDLSRCIFYSLVPSAGSNLHTHQVVHQIYSVDLQYCVHISNIYGSDSQPGVCVPQGALLLLSGGYVERLQRSLTNLKRIEFMI